MSDEKRGHLLVFLGFLVGLLGFIWNSNTSQDCSPSQTYGTGLLGSLAKLNSQLREQVCFQEGLSSPSTLLIIAGAAVAVVGLVIWFRKK
jgi:hypothetical protein